MGDPETNSLADSSFTQSVETEDSDASPIGAGPSGQRRGKLAIPGAQARSHLGRKRKAEAGLSDSGLQAYMDQQNRQLQDIYKAEQDRLTSFENLVRSNQMADERRFNAMQAQQHAQMQMFSQVLSNVVNIFSSGLPQHPPSQHPPPTHWMPTAPMRSTPTSTWSAPHPPRPLPQQPIIVPPPMQPLATGEDGEDTSDTPPVSHILNQLNESQHFFDL